jgi:hypothetical protein
MCFNFFKFGVKLAQKFGGKFVITNKPGKIDTSGVVPNPVPPKTPVPPVPPKPRP